MGMAHEQWVPGDGRRGADFPAAPAAPAPPRPRQRARRRPQRPQEATARAGTHPPSTPFGKEHST